MISMTAPSFTLDDVYQIILLHCQTGTAAKINGCLAYLIQQETIHASHAAASTWQSIDVGVPIFLTMTKADLVKTYEDRFRSNKGYARHLYEQVRDSGVDGVCPYCVQRTASTVDHHLPKSAYPMLSVCPRNLVPCCKDCNTIKLDDPATAADAYIHPYFDDLSQEEWLIATLDPNHANALVFSVARIAAWGSNLNSRVQHHFSKLELDVLYASHAAKERSGSKAFWAGILRDGGANALKALWAARAVSWSSADPNCWQAVAYRTWAADPTFCHGPF